MTRRNASARSEDNRLSYCQASRPHCRIRVLFNCVSISWSGTDGDFEASNREASSSWWRRGAARSDRTTARPRGIGTLPSMSVPPCLAVVTTTGTMCTQSAKRSAGLQEHSI